jgi:imidazolonepropionase-like amidohydrolase
VNPQRIPADAEVIELGDRTLLPGLLDYFTGDKWVTMSVYETAPDWAILGTMFARQTLEAGFTTVPRTTT